MVTVIIATNPIDLSSYIQFEEVSDVAGLLREELGPWPETARIYHNHIAADHDVTPPDEEAAARIGELDGILWVVVYPANPVALLVAAIAIAAIATVAMLFLIPKIPSTDISTSPNNSLGNRTNSARPLDRIPDIYGTVESTPDLIALPYKKYVNNLPVEYAYMCVGRGSYDVQAVYDGDTPIASIAGAAVAFYGPNTSPNSGDSPEIQIGSPISEPILTSIKSNEVTGQTLRPPNANQVTGDSDIRFVYPDTIQTNNSDIDFTSFFTTGDIVTVNNADFSGSTGTTTVAASAKFTYTRTIVFETYDPSAVFAAGQYVTVTNGGYAGDNSTGGVTYVDLSGTYLVSAVDGTTITLSNPQLVNSDWNSLNDYTDNETDYRSINLAISTSTSGINLNGTYTVLSTTSSTIVLSNPALVNSSWNNLEDLDDEATDYTSPTISSSSDTRWIGPFFLDLETLDRIIVNYTAAQGLYKVDDKGRPHPVQVSTIVEVTPVNANDVAIGAAETFTATMGLYDVIGDDPKNHPAGTKDPINYTHEIAPSFVGRCSVRVRRTSPTDLDYDGQVVDDLKWDELYGQAAVTQNDFGDVTTIHTVTYGTNSATSVKERKLNCIVTRKVPKRNSDNTFGPTLIATNSAADIICAMATDPYIGNRPLSELDIDGIYDTVDEVKAYFGFDEAGEFCYTFDDDNTSFEEMVQAVANAVFCFAYRQGSKIKLKFERQTDDSSLLFNHRNKIPGSETRTISFDNTNSYDGVEYQYVDPDTNTTTTIYIPTDQSAVNPNKVKSVGVRNKNQATVAAYRVYNKLLYQYASMEFDGMSEADLLVLNDRVLISDGTRVGSIEGEVKEQFGLVLRLSQPFVPVDGVSYVIILQHKNATTETIDIAAVPGEPNQVLLATAPTYALSLDPENYTRATYMIVGNTDVQSSAYLLTEKTPNDDSSIKLQAINYDDRYYANDLDFA